MKITNYARSAPKISDQGGGPMSPWGGTQNFGDGGGQVFMGGGTTPGWGRVPPIPPILDNPAILSKCYFIKHGNFNLIHKEKSLFYSENNLESKMTTFPYDFTNFKPNQWKCF